MCTVYEVVGWPRVLGVWFGGVKSWGGVGRLVPQWAGGWAGSVVLGSLIIPHNRGSTIDRPGVALCLRIFPLQIHMCVSADACTSGSTYVDSIGGMRRKYYCNTGIAETLSPNKFENILFQSHGSYGTVHRIVRRRSVLRFSFMSVAESRACMADACTQSRRV